MFLTIPIWVVLGYIINLCCLTECNQRRSLKHCSFPFMRVNAVLHLFNTTERHISLKAEHAGELLFSSSAHCTHLKTRHSPPAGPAHHACVGKMHSLKDKSEAHCGSCCYSAVALVVLGYTVRSLSSHIWWLSSRKCTHCQYGLKTGMTISCGRKTSFCSEWRPSYREAHFPPESLLPLWKPGGTFKAVTG